MTFLNNLISEEIFQFKNSQWNNLLNSLPKASTKFWNISKIIKKKNKCIPSLKQNGTVYITNNQKTEILAQTFVLNHTISSDLSDQNTKRIVSQSIDMVENHSQLTNNILVSVSSVKAIIKQLKAKKSPGIDGVSNCCLKKLPFKGLQLLCRIYNSCLNQCYFPLVWKQSKIIAIPKPGKDSSCPESYRPISLLNTLSKILEKILKEKIVNFIDDNNILPSQQFGFRAQHNTIQPLVRIKNIIKSNFIGGKSTAMVLLDIKAAFDSVWHDALIHKMLTIGMDMSIIKIIRSFLSSRSFKVYIGNNASKIYNISAGCPQGSCLSPILYNIFTYDFPVLEGCNSSIFADDTAILSTDILSEDIINNMETSVKIVVDFFNKWKIMINPAKTQSIFFTRRRKNCFVPQSNIMVENTRVPWEAKVKYLGVVLDRKLLFNDHISFIIHKINFTKKVMYPLINRHSELSIDNKLLLLKTVFHAILFYAAPVWYTASKCHLKKLQVCQNKLLKTIYNLPNHFSTSTLHSMSNIKLVSEKLQILYENFANRCRYSSYSHINSLCL